MALLTFYPEEAKGLGKCLAQSCSGGMQVVVGLRFDD